MQSATERSMRVQGHGGARAGAGRKPSAERRIKRSVSLSVATDTAVLEAMQPGESYSQALERLVQMTVAGREASVTQPSVVEELVATLGPEREAVAHVYRRLGWSRQAFEGIVLKGFHYQGVYKGHRYAAPRPSGATCRFTDVFPC